MIDLYSNDVIRTMLPKTSLLLAAPLALTLVTRPAPAADGPKPLKVWLVPGGCCHDYAKQKDILKPGDPRYLDLVTRGVPWACGKLGEDGKPLSSYGK